MSRKLARITRIKKLEKIENADKIVVASMVDSIWKVVVAKDEFKINDWAVYFEIDSFLPKKEPYLFLEGRCNKKLGNEEGYRLRTIKLRGQISQGLLIPVNKFSELKDIDLEIGKDVTELLNVKKYEPPIPVHIRGKVKSKFPSFVPKTDQERIQNLPEFYELYKDKEFMVTIKLDGTSGTFYLNDNNFGVCSRNLELKEDDTNVYWQMAKKYDIEKKIRKLNKNIAIQGEICGPKIQANRLKLNEVQLFVFDIFDINNQRYLAPDKFIKTIDILNEIDEIKILTVPIVSCNLKIFEQYDNFDKLQKYVQSLKSINDTMTEGIVCKLCAEERVSFKVINNKYLLKHGI